MLKTFIQTFKDNWTEFIETWELSKKVEHNYLNMNPLFERVKAFLVANDVYDSEERVEKKYKLSYKKPTLMEAIENACNVYHYIERIGTNDVVDGFYETMDSFCKEFSALVDCLSIFATNE